MGRNVSDDPESPGRVRRSSPRRSPSRRGRSPTRHKSSHNGSSPARDKHSSRAKSPKHGRSSSPRTRSPSPRTKRLRRAAEKVPDKSSDRDHERNRGRGSDKEAHRERVSDRELGGERKERSSRQDVKDGKSSRSRHGNSSSPSERHQRNRHRSPSPQPDAKNHDEVSGDFYYSKHDTLSDCLSLMKRTKLLTSDFLAYLRSDDDDSVAKMKAAEQALEAKQKDKPSFELSGKLAAETNRVRGITLLFNEPPDARKPDVRWRLYVFKAGEVLNEPLYIHRQSCYLFGRERRVADIPTDHPSCSKQHAVIQFRQVEKEQSDGTLSKQVRPYLMDLGSTNKTYINDAAIEPQRYYELFEKDTVRFGNSSREYVLLHEKSAG
ncbi:FHA domain-containing protein DDL [Cucumis melo var. makuwa]|uniref:FHA domain-containing protein DDL n=1 Tax=Cucumis melo var. makuwa TaxID=1194695 RepID=A0A5D3E2W8_CUCMM|nr:FHA domain-containing protein DDL [Cucumis melo var. makuwa]TYK29941.1 FHA domain-containing protein DDL [Cucumis melo var. makuwa]